MTRTIYIDPQTSYDVIWNRKRLTFSVVFRPSWWEQPNEMRVISKKTGDPISIHEADVENIADMLMQIAKLGDMR